MHEPTPPASQTPDPKHYGFLEQEYSSAWASINARIAARQNVQLTFTTVSGAACGMLLAEYPKVPPVFALILPPICLAFVLWHAQHNLTIALLAKFCEECEVTVREHFSIPAWHSPTQQWMKHTQLFRTFTEIGFLIVLCLVNAVAYLKALNISSEGLNQGLAHAIPILCGVASIVGECWVIYKRKDITKNYHFDRDKGELTRKSKYASTS
jgi:hypothetical protein